MSNLTKEFYKLADKEYAQFSAKLAPNIDPKTFIGVRVPEVRKFAKKYQDDKEVQTFLNTLPHKYFDENMLHGQFISNLKDYNQVISNLDEFLPYVDNWAVCDTISPKIFKKHKEELLKEIKRWLKSKHPYTIRFAIEMLMSHYLDEDFKPMYLQMVSKISSKEYYVNMMIAWYFATALAKQYNDTIIYLQEKKLDTWVHNKTIRKAIESYRIDDDTKQYLRTLAVK